MAVLIGWLMSLSLVAAVIFVHCQMMGWILRRQRQARQGSTREVVVALLSAHLLETAIFAVGIFIAAEVFSIGALVGDETGSLRTYLYYSMVTYTSLGLGDVLPTGEIRLISGFEVLTGLLMLGWSAAVLFEVTCKQRIS